jgi:hypothetical protein
MTELRKDIEDALTRPVCSGWDRDFLESILSQLDRGRQLSTKQITTATSVVMRNGQAAQDIHDEWESVYLSDHKEEAIVLATYYKTTGYFGELSRDILADIVPDMRGYNKMSGNKFAQKVLENFYSEPKYNVGDFVLARSSCTTRTIDAGPITNGALGFASAKLFKSKGGIILGICNEILSCAKGAKRYKIIPIGSALPVFIEERHIKLNRK